MNITPKTKVVGLLGHPIAHSLSPKLHNTVYRKLGLDMVYLAFDVGVNKLFEAMLGMKALGFIGFNVTIPYKESIMPFLDQVDHEAAMIGAVNTVKIKDGKFIGYNTDGMGFLHSLRVNGIDFRGKRILILGAGGAARAISIYLAKEDQDEILILNRSYERGENLAKIINNYVGKPTAKIVKEIPSDIDILINTTPIGMWPYCEGNPLDGISLNTNTIVCDIVYNPKITKMLAQAQKSDCVVIGGMDMLIGQGLKAIEIWTGIDIKQKEFENIL